MKRYLRWFFTLVALTAFAVILTAQYDSVVPLLAASYTGTARISGPVQLDVVISPPVGTPRDTLELTLEIRNHETAVASPIITTQFPPHMQLDVSHLPRGATVNLQANTLQWLPVLESGSGLKLSLPIRVVAADLKKPEQTITTVLQHRGNSQQADAGLWIGIAPQINTVLKDAHVAVGQSLQFEADVAGPGPIQQQWDLGDGRRLSVNNPQIVYGTPGVYDVTLTVTNPLGKVSRSTKITVVPHVVAQFAPDDETPGVDQMVTFHNESGGLGPLRHVWDFGDGTTSTEAHPHHVFSQPGIYQVSLLVENDLGVMQTNNTVTVGLPPSADMFVVESAPAGELVAGQALGDESTTEFAWEMGDGRRYEGTQINHTYGRTGDFYVTMIARNEFGTTRVGKWVHVDPGILKFYLPFVTNSGGLTEGNELDIDPSLGLTLEEVSLDESFVMAPLELPAGNSPTQQLFAYVNEARRLFDLPPLMQVDELSLAAQKHAQDMATYAHTNHAGADGSHPSERQTYFNYTRGYAGEATAWGFADPRQAVEFWVNSESHRPIILNRFATDLGLGFTTNYDAPSVWYWTAEFGNRSAQAWVATLRLREPATELQVLNSDHVTFSWNWPRPLATDEQFVLYFVRGGQLLKIGAVSEPLLDTRYGIVVTAVDDPTLLGSFEWFVRLENNGASIAEGPRRSLMIEFDPDLPTPTPAPTVTAPATVTSVPTITPTATAVAPSPTPRPTDVPQLPIVTATPLPTTTLPAPATIPPTATSTAPALPSATPLPTATPSPTSNP